MKLKIFAFFLVFLCTPLVAFGLCREFTTQEECVGSCVWNGYECTIECDKENLPGDLRYVSVTEEIEQNSGWCVEESFSYTCVSGAKWKAGITKPQTKDECTYKTENGLFVFYCKNGYYQKKAGAICNTCPDGFYCKDGAEPKTCPDGFYCKDGAEPKTCPDLQYVNEARTGCMTCDPGTYYDSSDRKCKKCPEGYTCSNGKQSTTACSDGTYSNGTTCVTCEAGHSCKNGIKKACAAGTSQGETGKPSCNPCGKGEYQDKEGQTSCKPCAVGTHQGATGQSKCDTCDVGKYQHETGQTKCLDCESGYFCPGNSDKIIENNSNPGFKDALERDNIITDKDYKKGIMYECPIGFYSNYAKDHAEPGGKNYCIPCPSSKTNTQTGSVSCDTYLFTNLTFKDAGGKWEWEGLSKTLEVSNNIYNVKLKAEQ